MNDVVTTLEPLEGTKWTPMGAPASERDLAALERAYGIALPLDFRSIYQRFGGGELIGRDGAMLMLEPVQDLLAHRDDAVLRERLPGALVFADDGGGYFFYDTEGSLGRGRFAVFRVGMGELEYASAVYVGATVSEAIDGILERGEIDAD